ncbi:hypothetical protein [Burkholderia gladioli]|uniref:hypothetical protein n=1 Tax=Burkholderia gladioli TaxID=28095 RepID=UPI0016408C16|nr:hypothetical protein [Burkholderia gladioli]
MSTDIGSNTSVRAMLALSIAQPGLDSNEIREALGLPANYVTPRAWNYVKAGMLRIEKREWRAQPLNAYYPTPKLVAMFPTMTFARRSRYKAWRDEDIVILMRDYSDRDTDELAAELGTTARAVQSMATRLGVEKSADYMARAVRRGGEASASLPVALRQVIQLAAQLRRKINEQH